jgi:sulfite exporter TauE/SafE
MVAWLLAGLILGLISSFHCIGMCGPLALILPTQHLSKFRQIIAIILYNSGRVMMYGIIGFIFGLLGRKIQLAGFQQWVSIISGIAILVFSFEYYIRKRNLEPSWMQAFHLRVQMLMQRFLQIRNPAGFILFGMANGLLPCGMVYLAIAGALTAASASQSSLFMILFGAGTMPAMIGLSILGTRMNLATRNFIRQVMPYITTVIAVLLILRGMNLGIPYISPMINSTNAAAISCH